MKSNVVEIPLSDRRIRHPSLIDKLGKKILQSVNAKLAPTELNVRFGGDQLAQRRHHNNLKKLNYRADSVALQAAISDGAHKPLFPELHTAKPRLFYNQDVVEQADQPQKKALELNPDLESIDDITVEKNSSLGQK